MEKQMKLYRITIGFNARWLGKTMDFIYFKGWSHRQAMELAKHYIKYMDYEPEWVTIHRIEPPVVGFIYEWEDWFC